MFFQIYVIYMVNFLKWTLVQRMLICGSCHIKKNLFNMIIILTQILLLQVDETNRKALYRLRQTWNDVFSNKTLYDIDVNIQKIDPAWPITAVSPVVASLPQQQSRPVQINKLTNNLNTTNTTITNNINSTSTHLSGISSGNGGGTNRPNQPVNSHANSHNTFNNNNNTSTEVIRIYFSQLYFQGEFLLYEKNFDFISISRVIFIIISYTIYVYIL